MAKHQPGAGSDVAAEWLNQSQSAVERCAKASRSTGSQNGAECPFEFGRNFAESPLSTFKRHSDTEADKPWKGFTICRYLFGSSYTGKSIIWVHTWRP